MKWDIVYLIPIICLKNHLNEETKIKNLIENAIRFFFGTGTVCLVNQQKAIII